MHAIPKQTLWYTHGSWKALCLLSNIKNGVLGGREIQHPGSFESCAGYDLIINAFYMCRGIDFFSPGFEADVRTSVVTIGESVDHLVLLV